MTYQSRSGVERRSSNATDDLVLLRLRDVMAACGMSRSCIYESVKNRSFPTPIKLNGRPSAWVKQEVQQWIRARIDASRAPAETVRKKSETAKSRR